jgi:hypothetical protein
LQLLKEKRKERSIPDKNSWRKGKITEPISPIKSSMALQMRDKHQQKKERQLPQEVNMEEILKEDGPRDNYL